MKQFDERDTIFSRLFELDEDTDKYNDYYKRNPNLINIDRELRKNSPGKYDHQVLEQRLVASTFQFLKDIRPLAHNQSASKNKVAIDPVSFTSFIKKITEDYGAVLTGVANMDKDLFYSYRGRGENYGTQVKENNPYSIVFAVEMNKTELLNAPNAKESAEVVRGYSRVALIGMIISYYIRNLGYEANCHMDGETNIPMVPVAEKAGLGEIGRMGLLITKDYGARIRLGAVTTNIPLITDNSKLFGLKKICEKCRKCSTNCPGEAIDKSIEPPWKPTNDVKCFSTWNKFGTDCGVCLVSCPFSK